MRRSPIYQELGDVYAYGYKSPPLGVRRLSLRDAQMGFMEFVEGKRER